MRRPSSRVRRDRPRVALPRRAVALLLVATIAATGITGCGKKPAAPNLGPDVIVPATTKVLSHSTQTAMTSRPGADTLVFLATATEAASLRIGDVIVGTVGSGFLKRILAVTHGPDEIVIIARDAALNEAIERGSLDFTRQIRPADVEVAAPLAAGVTSLSQAGAEEFVYEFRNAVLYDRDDLPATVFDQIVANGTLRVRLDLEFHVRFDGFQMKNLTLALHAHVVGDLEIRTGVSLHGRREVELHRFSMKPFAVSIGPVPVVFKPDVILYAGVDGRISADIETKVVTTADFTGGLSFRDGDWSRLSSVQTSHSFDPPHLTTNCEVRGYVGPRVQLLVYGVAGSYLQAGAFLRLEADPLDTPWWVLHAGVEAGIGVKLEAFSRTLANYVDNAVLSQSVVIAQAEAPPSGILGGAVRDAVTGAALVDVQVAATRPNFRAETMTTASGVYTLLLPAAPDYTLTFTKAGYLTATYADVAVRTGLETQLETLLQVDNAYQGLGTVGGRMANAINNASLPGVLVALRPGLNNRTGSMVASTTTDAYGSWSIANLAAGNYTAQGSKAGFLPVYVTITCIGNASTLAPDGVLTPILGPGELRVVLTWGATPSDLDSHMSGPAPGGGRFHMFYPYANANSGSPWPGYVELDLDDVTSYGPETTTLMYQLPGAYRFLVHDFTNRDLTFSTALGHSGAQVRVYNSEGLWQQFFVPTGVAGTLWTVFEVENGQCRPINTMTYQSDPSGILSTRPDYLKKGAAAPATPLR